MNLKQKANELGFVSKIKLVHENLKSPDMGELDKLLYYLWMTELQKYLIEVHNIRIFPYQGVSGNFKVDIFTYPMPNTVGKWERFNNIQSYNTYEQALEEGLFEALKII